MQVNAPLDLLYDVGCPTGENAGGKDGGDENAKLLFVHDGETPSLVVQATPAKGESGAAVNAAPDSAGSRPAGAPC